VDIGFRAGMNQGRAQVGALGSRKRKIVTAIGEAVDLASRLESSGRTHFIHTPAPLLKLLREAWVSKETRRIYDIAGAQSCEPVWNPRPEYQNFNGGFK